MNENLSEKVSVNINTATLSCIDILVDNGYYSNRSDFINQAVRDTLQKQQTIIDRIIELESKKENNDSQWFVGLYGIEKNMLEKLKNKGSRLKITGYGVLKIGKDIDEQLIFDTVESINIKGKVICSDSVKEHYNLCK